MTPALIERLKDLADVLDYEAISDTLNEAAAELSRSFPSTAAVQAPSEALELATALESNSATEYDRWRAAHLLRCQYAHPQAPRTIVASPDKASAERFLDNEKRKQQAPSEAVTWRKIGEDACARYVHWYSHGQSAHSGNMAYELVTAIRQMLAAAPSAGTPEEKP